MDLKAYHELTNDAWRYFRKYAEQIPMDDNAWSDAVSELSDILTRHDEIKRMAHRMMAGIIDELEHLDREAKGKE